MSTPLTCDVLVTLHVTMLPQHSCWHFHSQWEGSVLGLFPFFITVFFSMTLILSSDNFILQLLLVRWYLNQRVDWLDSRAELDRSGTLRTCWGHRWCIVNREAQWFCFPSHSQLPKTHIPFTIPVRSNFGRSCQILGFSHAVLGVLDTAAPTNSLGVTIFRGQKSLSFDFKLTWVS